MVREEFTIGSGKDTICCNLYNMKENHQNSQVKKLVLACHGFDSCKDGSSITKIAEKFSATSIPVISFDWAAHGKSCQELTVKNCMRILAGVEEKICHMYPEAQICLFGSSFGGYMILRYLSEHPDCLLNQRCSLVYLKSPAIRMDLIFAKDLIEESMENFQKRGYTIKRRNKEMKIPYEFYRELKEELISPEKVKKLKQEIFVFHGTDDQTARMEYVEGLKSDRIHLIPLEGAEHSFKGRYLEFMADEMIKKLQP